MTNLELCLWKTSKEIDAPNFESCRECGATRDSAIAKKCTTCLFLNSDGNYTANYLNLIKERPAGAL